MEMQIPRNVVRRKRRFDENDGLCVLPQSIDIAANCNRTCLFWVIVFVQVSAFEKVYTYCTHAGIQLILANEQARMAAVTIWILSALGCSQASNSAAKHFDGAAALHQKNIGRRDKCVKQSEYKKMKIIKISRCSTKAKLLLAGCWCSTPRVDIIHIIPSKQPPSLIPWSFNFPTSAQSPAACQSSPKSQPPSSLSGKTTSEHFHLWYAKTAAWKQSQLAWWIQPMLASALQWQDAQIGWFQ